MIFNDGTHIYNLFYIMYACMYVGFVPEINLFVFTVYSDYKCPQSTYWCEASLHFSYKQCKVVFAFISTLDFQFIRDTKKKCFCYK